MPLTQDRPYAVSHTGLTTQCHENDRGNPNEQDLLLKRLREQKSALALVEETLHEQAQNVEELLAAVERGQIGGGIADDSVTRQLHKDNDELRHENEELKQLLAALERERDRTATAASSGEVGSDVAVLRQLLEEKEALIRELREQPEHEPHDIDSYESELNEFRRQLESDRQKFNLEVEQLRARNKELDEATREMELEMSRERAELARERQRLDRLRDDVRLELERMQRDGGLRDRLAPVQNLRDQINTRKPAAMTPPPKQSPEEAMQTRLRELRSKINEG